MVDSNRTEKDVFISYASEERDSVAKPLAEVLTSLGVSVWFDQFDLKIGDSLRRKIDEGLAKCKYGVVVLSPSFFKKHYPNIELDGLAQKEIEGEKVILPIWVNIDEKQVRKFSLPLADRIAAQWNDGIIPVAMKLLDVIRPDIIETYRKKPIILLPKLSSGKEVVDNIIRCHFSYTHHDDTINEKEIDLVGGFIQELSDLSEIWDDIELTEQMRASLHISEMIKELKDEGWFVYGKKMTSKVKLTGVNGIWEQCAIAVLHGEPEYIAFRDNKFFIYKPDK
ncbi:MAG: toll/interleukin-1 receptor domain-containing protein [Bacteroidales bacterium]|nr:toll/interleukin-1 receptor domain-containing protein [Bacteroidales bacterium]